MNYFSYGSNMSLPRLRERVPGAERIGVFTLTGHTLKFHKVSNNDGSGKWDAMFTGNPKDSVVGALFKISESEKEGLDKAEGLEHGYLEKNVVVTDLQGNSFEAFTYYATNTDPSLMPYSWYLYHVIHGAKETKVPCCYLEVLEATLSTEDPDKERDARAIKGSVLAL